MPLGEELKKLWIYNPLTSFIKKTVIVTALDNFTCDLWLGFNTLNNRVNQSKCAFFVDQKL